MSKFQDAMRRVVTGDNAQGESVIIIDCATDKFNSYIKIL